jgi:hypothetical protein
MDINERSAYPHPDDFKVMRPEYVELEDGYHQATILIAPFKVSGRSVSKAGARRAAIYEAANTYRSYHPSYRLENPYPDVFIDEEGVSWKALSGIMKEKNGDYVFTDAEGEEDYADIAQMLSWDVRPGDTKSD